MRGRHGRSPTKPGVDSGGDRKHQGDLIELTIVDHLSIKLVTEPAARAKGDADRRLHAGADLFRRGERLTGPVSPSRLRLGVDYLTAVGGFVFRGVKG